MLGGSQVLSNLTASGKKLLSVAGCTDASVTWQKGEQSMKRVREFVHNTDGFVDAAVVK